jgi:hypothetical protein
VYYQLLTVQRLAKFAEAVTTPWTTGSAVADTCGRLVVDGGDGELEDGFLDPRPPPFEVSRWEIDRDPHRRRPAF